MSASPSRSGARVIAALVVLLVAAVATALWLATREDAAPPPKSARPGDAPHVETPPAPRQPRPKAPDVGAVEPESRPPKVEVTPPEPHDAEKIELDVAVFGSGGLPAPGATVLLLNPFAQHLETGGGAELARATADGTGHAKFAATGRMVRAYATLGREAGASDKFRPSETKTKVAVRMSSAIPVKGRVVESGGRPVAGASVRFMASPWFDDPFGLMVEGATNKDGTFELPAVPASAFESMRDGAATIEARATGWPSSSVTVTAESLGAGDVVVTLERGAFVRGRFVQPNGAPVAFEEVRLVDGRSVVRSGLDGTFELPLPRVGGAVIARAVPAQSDVATEGGLSSRSAAPLGWGAAKLLGRFRGDRGDVDLGDVRLSAGQPVKGVVVDLDEKPVAAGDVRLFLAGLPIASVQTDDAGKFEIEGVGEDDHLLTATEPPGPNAWSGQRHASVDGVRGGATDLRVRITGARSVLVKFLALADNSPVVVPEARIRADAVGATPKSYGWSWAGAGISTVRFEVEHAGTYTATVELPEYEPATTEPFEVSADREVRINVFFRKKP
jgi:hypothetical protein